MLHTSDTEHCDAVTAEQIILCEHMELFGEMVAIGDHMVWERG